MDNLRPLVIGSNSSVFSFDFLSSTTTYTVNETYRKTGTTKSLYYKDADNLDRAFPSNRWKLLLNLFRGTSSTSCQWILSCPNGQYTEFFGTYDFRVYPIDGNGSDLGTDLIQISGTGYQKYYDYPALPAPIWNELWGTMDLTGTYADYTGVMNGICIHVDFDVNTPQTPPSKRPTIYAYSQGIACDSYATNVNRYGG